MKEIIGLLCGIGFAIWGIRLHVSGRINKGSLVIIFACSIFGGFVISNYDVVTKVKGLGLELETARQEINKAKDEALDEMKKEIDVQKESIEMLIRAGNEMSERLKKNIEELEAVKDYIDSSSMQVFLKFETDKDTRLNPNGLIADSPRHECILKTKSGKEVTYVSGVGTTILTRNNRIYAFSFQAKLPPESNIYRDNPEEVLKASTIVIPLTYFSDFIKVFTTAEATCVLMQADIRFFVNNAEANHITQELNMEVTESKNNKLCVELK